MAKVFVSSDISKEKINFAISRDLELLEELEIQNDTNSLRSLIKKTLKEFQGAEGIEEVVFIMEYTGIYNNLLIRCLLTLNCKIYVCNGYEVKLSSGLTRGKTDKIDAIRIGQYAVRYFDKLEEYKLPSETVQQMAVLDTKLNQLKKTLSSFTQASEDNKKFMEKDLRKMLDEINKPVIKQLKASIKQVEKEIDRLIKLDEAVLKNFKIAVSVPGIGKRTATAMICVTHNFTKFLKGKSLASYCGVVPFVKESGKKKGKARLSHFANKKLKSLLHLGAVSLIRSNSQFATYYERKIAENKNPMLVLNNMRNKIVRALFACINKGVEYDKGYQHPLINLDKKNAVMY